MNRKFQTGIFNLDDWVEHLQNRYRFRLHVRKIRFREKDVFMSYLVALNPGPEPLPYSDESKSYLVCHPPGCTTLYSKSLERKHKLSFYAKVLCGFGPTPDVAVYDLFKDKSFRTGLLPKGEIYYISMRILSRDPEAEDFHLHKHFSSPTDHLKFDFYTSFRALRAGVNFETRRTHFSRWEYVLERASSGFIPPAMCEEADRSMRRLDRFSHLPRTVSRIISHYNPQIR
jgi:hypothetical protein